MKSFKEWFKIVTPTGWADIIVRVVEVAIVAFVVLQVKECVDAGTFDTVGTATDAALIAGGILLLNVILWLLRPK